MVTTVDAATFMVVIVKFADVAPDFTVTVAGTEATAGLELDRTTAAPPAGAGPFKYTLLPPLGALPPKTLTG